MVGRWRRDVALALVPWAGFLLSLPVAERFVEHRSLSWGGWAASAPWYLGFVALPSLLPIGAADHVVARGVAVVAMTATAVVAGVAVVAVDDAQAGLAVLWVPVVALPLAVVIAVGQALARRLLRRS